MHVLTKASTLSARSSRRKRPRPLSPHPRRPSLRTGIWISLRPARIFGDRPRSKPARVAPNVVPHRVVVGIETNLIHFRESPLDVPVVADNSVNCGHLTRPMQAICAKDEEWSLRGVANQRHELTHL